MGKEDIRLDFSKYAGSYSLEEAQKMLKSMKKDVFEAERDQDLKEAEERFGSGYTYELRPGTSVDLTKLPKTQRVCASKVKGYHVLMTEKQK